MRDSEDEAVHNVVPEPADPGEDEVLDGKENGTSDGFS